MHTQFVSSETNIFTFTSKTSHNIWRQNSEQKQTYDLKTVATHTKAYITNAAVVELRRRD